MNKKQIAVLIFIICILLAIIAVLKFYNKEKNEMADNTSKTSTSENKNENKNIENTENTSENVLIKSSTNNKATITAEAKPSGFMGSSLYKVIMYSNGEVYVLTYDGNGYEDINITSKELIAKKATSVKRAEDEENYGMVVISADEIIKNDIGWIEFK